MLSQAFTNADVIVGLVYEHANVEPMVVQKLDAKATLLVSQRVRKLRKYVVHYDP